MKKIHSTCNKIDGQTLKIPRPKCKTNVIACNATVCIVYLSYDMSAFRCLIGLKLNAHLYSFEIVQHLKQYRLISCALVADISASVSKIFCLWVQRYTQTISLIRSQGRAFKRDLVRAGQQSRGNR